MPDAALGESNDLNDLSGVFGQLNVEENHASYHKQDARRSRPPELFAVAIITELQKVSDDDYAFSNLLHRYEGNVSYGREASHYVQTPCCKTNTMITWSKVVCLHPVNHW